jgi:hypothetical protein
VSVSTEAHGLNRTSLADLLQYDFNIFFSKVISVTTVNLYSVGLLSNVSCPECLIRDS